MRGTAHSLDDLEWETEPDMGPGIGTGIRWKMLFSGKRTPTAEMSLGLAEIEPDGKLPMHRHAPAEIYHVTDGNGVVRIEGVEHPLHPGTAIFIPPNAWHETVASGGEALRFLFIFATDTFEDISYEFAEDD